MTKAIGISKTEVLVAIALIVITYLLFLLNVFKITTFSIAFWTGIIASVIASLFLKIYERYLASRNAIKRIFALADLIVTEANDFEQHLSWDIFSSSVKYLYMQITVEAHALTYKKEYDQLGKSLFYLVNAVSNKDTAKVLDEAKRLSKAIRKVTV